MRFLAGNGVLGQHNEVPDIPSHQRPPLCCRVTELLSVGKLYVSRLMGAHRIHADLAEPPRDLWGEVFVQVELHADRISPASSAAGVAFSAISASTSAAYFS